MRKVSGARPNSCEQWAEGVARGHEGKRAVRVSAGTQIGFILSCGIPLVASKSSPPELTPRAYLVVSQLTRRVVARQPIFVRQWRGNRRRLVSVYVQCVSKQVSERYVG